MEINEEIHASFSMVIDSLTLLKMQLSDVQTKIKNIEKVVKKELKKTNKTVINKNKEKKPPSGFAQPASVTKELSDFMDKPYGTKIARTQATKAVIDYIKAQKLQDNEKRSKINPDEKLQNLLEISNDELPNLNFFNIQQYMNKHFISPLQMNS